MNADPAFRKNILSRNPDLHQWSKSKPNLSNSPPNMTWHHNEKPGRLNLVHRGDHGGQHKVYHPTGNGGRDMWGGGKPGRKGKLNSNGMPKSSGAIKTC